MMIDPHFLFFLVWFVLMTKHIPQQVAISPPSLSSEIILWRKHEWILVQGIGGRIDKFVI